MTPEERAKKLLDDIRAHHADWAGAGYSITFRIGTQKIIEEAIRAAIAEERNDKESK